MNHGFKVMRNYALDADSQESNANISCNLSWDAITRQVYLTFYFYHCTNKYQNLRELEIILLDYDKNHIALDIIQHSAEVKIWYNSKRNYCTSVRGSGVLKLYCEINRYQKTLFLKVICAKQIKYLTLKFYGPFY